MPGDEAVAVHPDDPRYADLIGRTRALLPAAQQAHSHHRRRSCGPEFGTGCVKVTPAHDRTISKSAMRHHLPLIEVIGPDGRMTTTPGRNFARPGPFQGAQKAVVEKLMALGLLLKRRTTRTTSATASAADVPIEPCLSEQWFLKYPSVEKARAVVATGEMKFYPERWAKVYDHWMEASKTGASAANCGGDIAFRSGINECI